MSSVSTHNSILPGESAAQTSAPLLRVRDLAVAFRSSGTLARAVDGVSFSVYPNQTLAVVGESGCGKSVTAMAMMRLLPIPPAVIDRGRADFLSAAGPVDLLALDHPRMRQIRGGDIAMIFQEPMTCLNPVFTVGEQIIEAVKIHQHVSSHQAKSIAAAALEEVGIRDAASRLSQYPHEFSGGMRQRVMIAMALACKPRLLLADEPTTALDVTVQAQILALLKSLRTTRGMGQLLITHDMGVVATVADVVCVMYAGRVVEYANVFDLFDRPLHPYTRSLLACIPRASSRVERLRTVREVIDDPREFEGLTLNNQPVKPWWPRHEPPADVIRADAPPHDSTLAQLEPGRWVNVWRTPAAAAPQPEPDLDFRRDE
jgi:ABC-type dipeptide/oligopeptide/nickel transport system ATPase component